MTLAPRVVIVHRASELDELIRRHATRGQVEFFLGSRGRSLAELQHRHDAQLAGLRAVAAGVPPEWRSGRVERGDLTRFLFSPEDVVVVVGQDGLVANVAKYLDGQPVIGVDTDPDRNPGVLVRHRPEAVAGLLEALVAGERGLLESRTMVEALADDGQRLCAVNEVFLGPATHQTARYALHLPDGLAETQASSGLIVATGTGATGWARSLWLEHHSTLHLPVPTEASLVWFVREAWPSPATGTSLVEGLIAGEPLSLTVSCDELVAFGDGLEADRLTLTWGQSVTVGVSSRVLRLAS